jgi:hypothetical protein
MADIEWLPAPQLREHYVDPIATDMSDAERRLYLAVVTGQVRARMKGRILDYKQIALTNEWRHPLQPVIRNRIVG